MSGISSPSGDPLAAFDTIRVTTEDIQTHYHDLPPLSTIYLPEDMLSFPRNRYEENFGYPWYLYVDGQYAWKMRWAARAASRAWRRAIERGDITYAIPPRYRDPMPEGKDRQVLLEESLCLTVVDKALEMYVPVPALAARRSLADELATLGPERCERSTRFGAFTSKTGLAVT